MKKIMIPSLLLSCLALPPLVFATATPRCAGTGKLALAIVNQDLDGCPKGSTTDKFCTYNFYNHATLGYDVLCGKNKASLFPGQSISLSYLRLPRNACIRQHVSRGTTQLPDLRLCYYDGVLKDNCNKVFGGAVQCTISQTGGERHPTYILTLHKTT